MGLLEPVSIPEGQRGPWTLTKFTVSAEESRFDALRAVVTGSGRYTPPGTYTALKRGDAIIMSDTPDEMRDHSRAVQQARDAVLINGLGIGMVLANVLRNQNVTRAIVVEIDRDVLDLVAPHYYRQDARVEIVHADAFEYTPPKGLRFGMVWHDIWPDICADNLPEMTRLKRKYGRRTDWQGCWAEYECRRRA